MAVEHGTVERVLGGLGSRARRDAGRMAATLAPRLEFLTWTDRAALLDGFFWNEARARLEHEIITAVINRRGGEAAAAIDAYALYCRTVVTAILLKLDEPARIERAVAALTCRFSLLPEHREVAEAWLDADNDGLTARALARCPGYAFLLLALSPNDTAASFMARDAFFAAMLGHG